MAAQRGDERTRLLPNGNRDTSHEETVEFEEDDEANPRKWPLRRKYLQTLQIFLVAFICPMASSIFAPAIDEISKSLGASQQAVIAGQAGFVCMLGIGPLLLAPMSETFGRRLIYLLNLSIFTLLQIPTALAPNIATFVVLRTFSGFFGSVGVANGGGSISDLFETHERSKVLGIYLVAPLLGPTIGPLIGGLIAAQSNWRIIFWAIMIASGSITVVCYFFLYETNAVTILLWRKQKLQKENPKITYKVEGASDQSIPVKIAQNSTRAIRILITQPVVLILSSYQALVFSTMYSLYAQYSTIWSSPPYDFDRIQVGLAYLGPAIGFILTAILIVATIDKLYNWLSRRNGTEGLPEYRLPLVNIGAIFLPVSLFWFGWTIEKQMSWLIPLASTLLFGASQIAIFNPVQTYYIDSFEANAASAVAAGACLRSIVGGIVPLFVSGLFDDLGYGWGMSVFGFLSVLLMPAPLLFQLYGKKLRDRFPFRP